MLELVARYGIGPRSLGHNIKMVPSRVPDLRYRLLDANHDADLGVKGTLLRCILAALLMESCRRDDRVAVL